MGAPLDETSTTLEAATSELVGCEALMRLAFSIPGAGALHCVSVYEYVWLLRMTLFALFVCV